MIFSRVRFWLRSAILRHRIEREMHEEMAEHLARAAERFAARGLSDVEARHAASREFGNVGLLQEQSRDVRGTQWITALGADARFALRHFRRRYATALTMLVVLTVGIVLSAQLFSFVHAYTTEPPHGIERSPDLVRLRGSQITPRGRSNRPFSIDEIRAFEGLSDQFASVAGWMNIAADFELPDRTTLQTTPGFATFVTGDYFAVLGAPMVGRTPADPATAVISHRLWESMFAGRPSAIGSTLNVNGVTVTIVGIAPPRFNGVDASDAPQVFMPLEARASFAPIFDPHDEQFGAAARLRPHTSLSAASAATALVATRFVAAVPARIVSDYRRTVSADVVPLLATNGDANFDADARLMALAFSALATLILIVTCTNVSALQTGLAMARRREIAIRLSMGASRSRLVRQLLTECVLLASAAGAAALGLIAAIDHLVVARITALPFDISLDPAAVAFTLGVALTTGVLFGLSPALHGTRLEVGSALKDAPSTPTARRARLQRVLVIAQIGCTQPLVVAFAALLLMVVREYRRTAFTASAEHVISLRMRTGANDSAFAELVRVRDRIAATPGVSAAALEPEPGDTYSEYRVQPSDRTAGSPQGRFPLAGPLAAPGHLAAMGIRVVLGRDIGPSDIRGPAAARASAVPVIISSQLAETLWPGANPLGRRLQPNDDRRANQQTLIVIGVAELRPDADATSDDLRSIIVAADSAQLATASSLLVRTPGDAESLMPELRRIVQREAPHLTISGLRTMADMQSGPRHAFMVALSVLAGACVLAMCLSAIGLYSVIAFAVQERTSEIAVRMAVGARVQQIVALFVRDGVRLSAIGLVFGLPASLVALAVLQRMAAWEQTVPVAPIAAIAGFGVAIVALTASWIPARRAAGIDPAGVLRRD